MGYYIRNGHIKDSVSISKSFLPGLWHALICFVLIYAYKFSAKYSDLILQLQYIIYPVLVILFVIYTRRFAIHLSKIDLSDKVKQRMSTISNYTLDIYVTQVFLIDVFPMHQKYWYAEMLAIVVSIISCSVVYHKLSDVIANSLNKMLRLKWINTIIS